LVSETKRYPQKYHNLPGRQAEIPTIQKFDSLFFGISSNQAACVDPQVRLLLEAVFEAVVDAGYCMEDLAGSATGVYVGGCFSDLHKAMLKDLRGISGYENTGCSHSMFSNRISFCFDFHGPSMTIDTACSSSLVAFDLAVRDIRSGKITRAIVGGVSILMDPAVTKSFHAYNMLSPDGKCHSFDSKANGYVRADAIGAVLLEAGSIVDLAGGGGYMQVLGTGVNSDGWKTTGRIIMMM
jgi:fatty acid synthase